MCWSSTIPISPVSSQEIVPMFSVSMPLKYRASKICSLFKRRTNWRGTSDRSSLIRLSWGLRRWLCMRWLRVRIDRRMWGRSTSEQSWWIKPQYPFSTVSVRTSLYRNVGVGQWRDRKEDFGEYCGVWL